MPIRSDPSERETVIADKIHLVDDSGVERIFMGASEGKSVIELRDEHSAARLVIGLDAVTGESTISLQDGQERPRLTLACSEAGSARIELQTGDGRVGILCDSIVDDDPRLTVCDQSGRVLFSTREEDEVGEPVVKSELK